MLNEGLEEEAREVLSKTLSFTSVKAIGYKELMPYFEHSATLEECVEKLKRETRRYAKRHGVSFEEARRFYPVLSSRRFIRMARLLRGSEALGWIAIRLCRSFDRNFLCSSRPA